MSVAPDEDCLIWGSYGWVRGDVKEACLPLGHSCLLVSSLVLWVSIPGSWVVLRGLPWRLSIRKGQQEDERYGGITNIECRRERHYKGEEIFRMCSLSRLGWFTVVDQKRMKILIHGRTHVFERIHNRRRLFNKGLVGVGKLE